MMKTLKASNDGFILLRTLIALLAISICLASLLASVAGLIKRNALLKQKVELEIEYRNDSGFSLIESIVAIALIVIFCGLSGAALLAAWQGSTKSAVKGKEAFAVIRTDDALRHAVFEIPLSYWEGERGAYEKAFAAIEEDKIFSGNIALKNTEAFYDKEGGAKGLKIIYAIGENEYECDAPFGTMLLSGGAR
jgi:prepilin-type N-terminal cleavage/methylation domain-containing protein